MQPMNRILLLLLLVPALTGCNRLYGTKGLKKAYSVKTRWESGHGRKVVLRFVDDSTMTVAVKYRNRRAEYDKTPAAYRYTVEKTCDPAIGRLIIRSLTPVDGWGTVDASRIDVPRSHAIIGPRIAPTISEIYEGLRLPATDTLYYCSTANGIGMRSYPDLIVWSGLGLTFSDKRVTFAKRFYVAWVAKYIEDLQDTDRRTHEADSLRLRSNTKACHE